MLLPLLVVKPGQTQKGNPYWLGPHPVSRDEERKRASECITDSRDIWLRSWKNILQLENLSNSTSLHTILPPSQRINVYSNTWIPGDIFLPLAVVKWLLGFLGPFGMFLTPTAQNFQVSWEHKQPSHALTEFLHTPETTNVSCYQWGFRKDACPGWRLTGRLNTIFRGDGEGSTHEKNVSSLLMAPTMTASGKGYLKYGKLLIHF